MVALARMYQQGRGTDKDAIKAKVLYERAGFDPDELPGY
jgi:TPR repeat protein